MLRPPFDVVVLNTIQAAAADLTLAGGKFDITNLGEEIKLSDGNSFTEIAYAAGTLSVKDYDFASGVTLAGDTQYRLEVDMASPLTDEALNANPRVYQVASATAAPTAAVLRDLFVTAVQQDPQRRVNATAGAGANLRLTLIDFDRGDFNVTDVNGAAEAIITPFVAPAGTPEIVEALASSQSSPTANYTTYEIRYNRSAPNNGVGGAFVSRPEIVVVFADALAANFAAFDTEITAIFDGSHTPVADYLGI